jgi:hypothetical protein
MGIINLQMRATNTSVNEKIYNGSHTDDYVVCIYRGRCLCSPLKIIVKNKKKVAYVMVTGSTTTNGHHCGTVNAFSTEPSHPLLVQDPIGICHNQRGEGFYRTNLEEQFSCAGHAMKKYLNH